VSQQTDRQIDRQTDSQAPRPEHLELVCLTVCCINRSSRHNTGLQALMFTTPLTHYPFLPAFYNSSFLPSCLRVLLPSCIEVTPAIYNSSFLFKAPFFHCLKIHPVFYHFSFCLWVPSPFYPSFFLPIVSLLFYPSSFMSKSASISPPFSVSTTSAFPVLTSVRSNSFFPLTVFLFIFLELYRCMYFVRTYLSCILGRGFGMRPN
jgi:hypothetical protein